MLRSLDFFCLPGRAINHRWHAFSDLHEEQIQQVFPNSPLWASLQSPCPSCHLGCHGPHNCRTAEAPPAALSPSRQSPLGKHPMWSHWLNAANTITPLWNQMTHPAACLDAPCPKPAAAFLFVGRPHLFCMSQKRRLQIQTQVGWWRPPLHP